MAPSTWRNVLQKQKVTHGFCLEREHRYMYLKALEIQGFKSFPDRTRISFELGITAVVGPNGSGKSNISDAIRWVMGETSVKQLRGGGKMENVIFGGTQTRGAMGYASVQLILDNTDRRLDVDAKEVAIGRKYYRSGDSEYSINGQSVRLRDVYELLLDTGLGRDGYSIIGQGRVAEIVGAKSAERREIFEEASGIARFRYRKNEAERRLLSTEDNLVRLRDILAELEGRVGPLEKECEKAKRFLTLSDEKKSMEVTLWVDVIRATREELRCQQRKVEIAEADYTQKGAEIDKIDEETLGIRAEIERIIIDIERSNGNIRALQEELSGRDAKIAVLENNIEHHRESMQAVSCELKQSDAGDENITKEMERHEEIVRQDEEKLATAQREITVIEKRLEEMIQHSQASGERRGALQAKLAELTAQATESRVEQAESAAAVEAAEQNLSQLQQVANQAVEDLALTQTEHEETQAFLKDVQAELAKLENIKVGLAMKVQTRSKALQEAEEAVRKVRTEAESGRQRLHMLKELEHSLDGFQNSVRQVMKAARNGKLRGIIGPVSSILSVQKGYEVAIETALGYSMQNLVVENENAAKAAMAFLKQTGAGRATFLPLDTVKPQQFTGNLPQGAQQAKRLVQYNAQYENIVSSLLARIVVVEDITEASSVARALEYRNRVVTQDGQVINAGGSFTGGSVSRTAGLFSRQQEMEALQAKMSGWQQQLTEAQEAEQKARAEVDALQAELTATESEIITRGGDKIRIETELARLDSAVESAMERSEQTVQEQAQMEARKVALQQKRQSAAQDEAKWQREVAALSVELTNLAGADDNFLQERELLSEKLSALRLSALGHERDVQLHRQSIETMHSRRSESAARKQMLQENKLRLQAEIAEYEERIKNIGLETVSGKERMQQLEDEIQTLTQLRLAKEGSITAQMSREREITAERESLGREMTRLSEQKNTMETRYDNTVNQLWEEYELGPIEAESYCVAFDSVAELRRQVSEVRGKIRALGNVNVGAIEEFEEVNTRYRFLKEQTEDVEASKRELEKMIATLCAEMTELFRASFLQINANFGRIFTELFGGGQAGLSLANPDDLLESGIDIEVAPPGKIIKDLSALSGGEQSLVAICIYFAILGVNPSPFCVLDEIEAALDDVNVLRFAQYLRRITKETQFIVITHRRGTMEEADVLYGVTMQEDGVSKMLRLGVSEVEASMLR